MHVSFSPWGGARGLQRVPCFKYYNALSEYVRNTVTIWLSHSVATAVNSAFARVGYDSTTHISRIPELESEIIRLPLLLFASVFKIKNFVLAFAFQ